MENEEGWAAHRTEEFIPPPPRLPQVLKFFGDGYVAVKASVTRNEGTLLCDVFTKDAAKRSPKKARGAAPPTCAARGSHTVHPVLPFARIPSLLPRRGANVLLLSPTRNGCPPALNQRPERAPLVRRRPTYSESEQGVELCTFLTSKCAMASREPSLCNQITQTSVLKRQVSPWDGPDSASALPAGVPTCSWRSLWRPRWPRRARCPRARTG